MVQVGTVCVHVFETTVTKENDARQGQQGTLTGTYQLVVVGDPNEACGRSWSERKVKGQRDYL